MALFILFLWFISVLKSGLFWLYLVQLKEYKIKRLLDHLQTDKGQKLLYDKSTIAKLFIAASFLITSKIFFYITSIAYVAEIAHIGKKLYEKRLKMPVKTSSSVVLTAIFLLITIILGAVAYTISLSLNQLATYLILIDIITPLIVFGIVFSLKPINNIIRKKLFERAKTKRESLKELLVIGIVGSYGKTSTKEFLYEMLKDKFNVIKTEEHQNTEIAIANLILNKLKPEHEIFICEIGAYEEGEIKTVAKMIMPKIGVFMGANEQHLSLFGTMEKLLRGEGGEELLENLQKRSLGIFNGNNKYAYDLYKKATIAKRITYSPNLVEIINPEKRDVRAENINTGKENIKFRVVSNKDSRGADFKINLLGAHNIENILVATAVAEEMGLTLQEIAESIKTIQPIDKTMVLSKNKAGLNIISSTYSSNPSAVRAHIEYLKVWGDARKIVIMPCLIELGEASAKIHKQIGKWLAETCDMAIITNKDKFEEIQKGAKESNKNKLELVNLETSKEIIEKIKSFSKKGDVILMEGRLQEDLIKEIEN